jgi:uncharacterized protein YuzE
MRITYDPAVDALYIYFREDDVATTQEVAEGVQLDLDAEGRVIGIEILGYRERVSSDAPSSVSVTVPLPG